jgi:hypothetical protein
LSTRNFSIGLIAGCILLFVATAAANIVIDPQFVFRTGILQRPPNPNQRYQRVLEYERDAPGIDGLLFGASRGQAFDPAEFGRLTGLGHAALLAVPAGSMSDHLPFLEYILHDKAARGERIKEILLLLDPDLFGARPWTNANLDSFLPPQLSGESRLRFWLRYLSAVQFQGWRDSLISSGWLAKPARSASSVVDRRFASLTHQNLVLSDHAGYSLINVENDRGRLQDRRRSGTSSAALAERLERISRSRQPYLEVQIVRLERFISLCRLNRIRLTIAINPLSEAVASGYEPGRLDAVVSRINQLADVWDFAAPDWLARDAANWLDASHFKAGIASMMLQRMYASAASPADFGRLRARTGP